MKQDSIPLFPGGQQQENLTENQEHKEKVPWKLGRHIKPHQEEMLDKLVKDYKQDMLKLLNLQNDKRSCSYLNKNIH